MCENKCLAVPACHVERCKRWNESGEYWYIRIRFGENECIRQTLSHFVARPSSRGRILSVILNEKSSNWARFSYYISACTRWYSRASRWWWCAWKMTNINNLRHYDEVTGWGSGDSERRRRKQKALQCNFASCSSAQRRKIEENWWIIGEWWSCPSPPTVQETVHSVHDHNLVKLLDNNDRASVDSGPGFLSFEQTVRRN